VVANVPLCRQHLEAITEALGAEVRTVPTAVVYYIGDPATQQVKIGCTTRMSLRFAAIANQRPGAVLLAIEPGFMDREHQRHRQFAHLRVTHHGGNREWYRKAPDLMEWINEARRQYGDPWEHEAVQAVR
jgi:hypothetical protein